MWGCRIVPDRTVGRNTEVVEHWGDKMFICLGISGTEARKVEEGQVKAHLESGVNHVDLGSH